MYKIADLLLRALLIIAAVAITACNGGDDGGNGGDNGVSELLVNPGFESGKEGWISLDTEGWNPEFAISTDIAHEGEASALLQMRVPPGSTAPTRIFGVVQEIRPEEFPQQVSGWYRVDTWERATPIQYLQVVVVAVNAANRPAGFPNHQIRYILDGIGQPAFRIDNAKYIFLNPGDPQLDEWKQFTLNVANDFREQWGAVPEDFEYIRLLFEVRYDSRTSGQLPVADVYYDTLHAGDAVED